MSSTSSGTGAMSGDSSPSKGALQMDESGSTLARLGCRTVVISGGGLGMENSVGIAFRFRRSLLPYTRIYVTLNMII